MCIRPVTMPARASLAVRTKRGSNASCRNGRQPFSRTRTGPDRQRPIGQPHNGANARRRHQEPRTRHRPSPACAPVRQNRLVPAAGPHAQQEEHTTPHPLSLSLPSQDLTSDSPRGAELPFTRAAYGMRRSMQICHVLLAIYARLRLPIAGEGIPHTGRRECSLNPRRDDQQLPSSYLWRASLVH